METEIQNILKQRGYKTNKLHLNTCLYFVCYRLLMKREMKLKKAAQERPGAAEVEATSGRGGERSGPHGARGPAPVSRDQAEDQD